MTEVAYCKESVTPDNVYVIDNGLELFQVRLLCSPFHHVTHTYMLKCPNDFSTKLYSTTLHQLTYFLLNPFRIKLQLYLKLQSLLL